MTYQSEIPADSVMQDVTPDRVVVPVTVETPVDVRELPKIPGGMWTEPTVGTTPSTAAHLLVTDPKRANATIIALDQAVYFGTDQGTVVRGDGGVPNGMVWPANTPYVVTHTGEVWCAAVTGTTKVSVAVEKWAQ